MNFSEFKKQTTPKLDESSNVVPKEPYNKLTPFQMYMAKKGAVPKETVKPSATKDTSQLSDIVASPNVDITKVLASNKRVEKKANKDAVKKLTESKKDDDDEDDEKDNDEVKEKKGKRHVNSSAKKSQNYRDPNSGKLKVRLVPKTDNIVKEEFNFSVFLENSHKSKVYKGAQPAQDFQTDWTPLQKKLYDMQTIRIDKNADIDQVLDKNSAEMNKTKTSTPKTRKGDKSQGHKLIKVKEQR